MPKSPCPPGETRNRSTRKCRPKKRPGRRAKTPCAPGQTRNRATKKCREKKRRGPAPKTKAATPKVATPVEPTEYRADLYEEVDGKFRRRSTEHFIEIDDEFNNMYDTCMGHIMDMITEKVAPSKGFFDTQAYPENSYVTIMSDEPLPERMLGVIHIGALPAHCTENRVGFKISAM